MNVCLIGSQAAASAGRAARLPGETHARYAAPMRTLRAPVVRAVVAWWVLTLVHPSPVLAEKFTVGTGPFGITCTSTGQICDPPETLTIGDPARALKVKKFVYDASAAHCSSGRILIELDGRQVGKMRFVSRNERATLRKRIRLAPGAHMLAFRFQGKLGGCNVGSVSGWGGEITVTGRR